MTPRSALRVVMVNDSSIARGGATGLALLSARLLAERGIAVTYLAGDDGAAKDLAALGVDIRPLGGQQLVRETAARAATRGIYNPEARALVARTIAELDGPSTVYHVHGWSKILSPSIFTALRPVAARTVIHAHDFFLACPNGGFMDYRAEEPCARRPLGLSCLATNCDKRSYSQKLWRVGRQLTLHRTLDRTAPWSAFAMIHPAMAPYLAMAGYPAARLREVRNPVLPFREERIQVERNRAVFFIGRVEAEKGIEELIAATARAAMPLTVIGEGPLREELTLRHPEVSFLGWRSREEMTELVGAARLLAMPSRYPEPFGLVAVEASQSGLPVILSDTAFLAKEMSREGVGFACRTRDPAAFADSLAKVRDMPEAEIRTMSERGFARTAPLAGTSDQWIDQLLSLYASAVTESFARA